MEQNIVVFFVNNWQMDDGKTGCTVNYFFLDENGRIPVVVTGLTGSAGYQRAKVSLDSYERSKFVTVPGKYKGRFEMTVGSDGKPVLQLKEILSYCCPMYMTDKNPETIGGNSEAGAAPANETKGSKK